MSPEFYRAMANHLDEEWNNADKNLLHLGGGSRRLMDCYGDARDALLDLADELEDLQ